MHGKRIAVTLSALLIFAVASPSFAIMSAPYGWYFEANVGAGKLRDKSYPGNASTANVGGNANLGYKFMPFFASEIGYTQYGNTTIKDPNSGSEAGIDRHYMVDWALKSIVPFQDTGFEAFAKIGIAWLRSRTSISNAQAAANIGLTSQSKSNTGGYIGMGAQYYLNPELAVVGQWNRGKGNSGTGTLDLVSIGVSFIFD